MFTRVCVVTAVIALLISCSALGRVDCEGHFVYNEASFTDEQQLWIQESSERWNTWVGHPVTFVHPGSTGICTIDKGAAGGEHIGLEMGWTQNIIIDVDALQQLKTLDRAHFEGVAMHEMGHALGYVHVGAPGTALMSAACALDFTEIDREQCVARGMCSKSSE